MEVIPNTLWGKIFHDITKARPVSSDRHWLFYSVIFIGIAFCIRSIIALPIVNLPVSLIAFPIYFFILKIILSNGEDKDGLDIYDRGYVLLFFVGFSIILFLSIFVAVFILFPHMLIMFLPLILGTTFIIWLALYCDI